MKKITIKLTDTGLFKLSEDGDWVCAHDEAYIEKACCSTVGTSGYIECGCGGRDSIVCPSYHCTGIMDWEIDDLFDQAGGGDEW